VRPTDLEPPEAEPSHGRHLRAVSEEEILISAPDLPPVIPEGVYEAAGGRARRYVAFRVQKLAVDFRVIVPDTGAPNGSHTVTLTRHYNLTPDSGNGARRRVKARLGSAFLREWILTSGRRPPRSDQLSARIFEGKLFKVRVATVKHDSRQRPLPEEARYSVVAQILEVLTT
jgi:hypothetical protein